MTHWFLLLMSCTVLSQSKFPNLPSIPLNGQLQVKYDGIWPNSVYKEGDPKTAAFKRMEYQPPTLKLLIRANCSDRLGQNELIGKAQSISSSNGDVVELDWDNVNGKNVVFYVVILLEKRLTHYKLQAKEGKYIVASSEVKVFQNWHTAKLLFPSGKTCINEDSLPVRTMQLTILNLLNRLGVPHLNSKIPD